MKSADFSVKQWLILPAFAVMCLQIGVVCAETTTVTYQVSAGDDNACSSEYSQSMGYTFLRVGYWDGEPPPFTMSAMRFRDVNVPQGTLILDARLKIRAHSNPVTGESLYGVIHAENADNPVDFSGRNIRDIIKTDAEVNWDHSTYWSTNRLYTSPDISTMVQEVIDRPGWSAGNAMVITYSNRKSDGEYRHFLSYEFPTEPPHYGAPILEITYGYPPTGDIEPDGDVDMEDFAVFARAWHTEEGDDFWNPACDLYADGFIDIFDLDLVVGNWLSSL